jgi:3-oxoacyl-[acyl-carrier-protein] synthase-3
MGAKLVAIEYVFGSNMITNADLSKEFPDYDFDNFENKVGIKRRYVVKENETALDLAIKACELLFNRVDKSTIDYIIYCTQSPEYILPTTACLLQNRLALKTNIGAFDFNLGCSGYTYGLAMAKSLINSKQATNVLLVTAETYSKYLNPKDRSNRAIFGDAASCSLITASEVDAMHEFAFGTDGSGYDKLIINNGAARNKYDLLAENIEYGTGNIYTKNELYMNGPEVFNFTSSVIPGFVRDLLAQNDLNIENIDQYIFHQANAFMLNFMRKRLKISEDKFFIDLADGGNTVSNTIPIALKQYSFRLNPLKEQKILLVGFGVGLSWSGGMITIDNNL